MCLIFRRNHVHTMKIRREIVIFFYISWSQCSILCINLISIRYEGQRDMLYNQTFNLDQVAFASEGIKDAQQTVMLCSFFWFHLMIRKFFIVDNW